MVIDSFGIIKTIFWRQRTALDVFQTEVMPLMVMTPETGFDATEAVMSVDLGEQQRDQMLLSIEILRIAVAWVCFSSFSNSYLGKILSDYPRILVTCLMVSNSF